MEALTQMLVDCPVLHGKNPGILNEVAQIFVKNSFKADGSTLKEMLEFSTIDVWDLELNGKKTAAHAQIIAKLLEWANGTDRTVMPSAPNRECQNSVEDLISALTEKSKKKEPKHVDMTNALKQNCGNWHQFSVPIWPKQDSVNALAEQVVKQKDLGLPFAFVASDPVSFIPPWVGKDHMPGSDGLIKFPNILVGCLTRWAHAAMAANMFPLAIGFLHIDNCLRACTEAVTKKKPNATAAAALYDRLKQEDLQEKALRALPGVDVCKELSEFDRDLMQKICDLLDANGADLTVAWKTNSNKSNWGRQYSKPGADWSLKKSWGHDHGKRKYEGYSHGGQTKKWKSNY